MDFKAKAEAAMQGRLDKLRHELSAVRTGRANPKMLDGLRVEYYGTQVPVKQVAAVSVPEARTLEIRPFDPSVVEAIEKAIQKSDLGVPPQSDGKIVRVIFPAMNEERRKEVAKMVGKIGEEYRVSIRGERQEAMQAVKKHAKDANLPEDELKKLEGAIQKITDSFIKLIDQAVADKQKEVTSI